ncbi:Hypothetical predicted protein [Cloeon dipterum]|uniref:Nop domain-containing protein n=2 Tax=Cloeon dipterum TaxID=197152 RepID=A0A8S1C8Z1_9INSE|nr:Hypothetical predicted protein [Cloeon dipterum]
MLVLYETSAGYAIFKLLDEKKLQATDNLFKDFESPAKANKILKLKQFSKFTDTTDALAATTAAVEGKVSKQLKKVLKKLVLPDVQEKLLVADAKLGGAIKEKFNFSCLTNSNVQELMRCIRSQINGLLGELPEKEMTAMALGLAHSLSRYKLKFSPDKVDTMIIQAVSLLDDLDKELNNYIMRCREWYGWHFPELSKLVTDNTAYIKIVQQVGTREKMIKSDLSEIIPEELEALVKEAAEISMGTEISDEDIDNIQMLCIEILAMITHRTSLFEYLKSRMMVIAPNLSIMVGELIGARLISRAGSLVNLSKFPASTVQLLGSEKALFRALKTKRDTPKYGLIYHATLVGQASTKNKGKAARMLAAKASLACRVDALGEDGNVDLGAEHKAKLASRMRNLEEGNQRRISSGGKGSAKKHEKFQFKSEVAQYEPEMDSTLPVKKKKKRPLVEEVGESSSPAAKKLKVEVKDEEADAEPTSEKKKKKKKRTMEVEDTAAAEPEEPVSAKKKKKKSMQPEEVEAVAVAEVNAEPTSEKKKKKKKSKVADE